MKVLLIYPQYTYSTEFDLRAPSMSLFYLASTLEHNGHEVMIYDASLGPIVKEAKVFRYGFSDEEVRSFLRSQRFDIVGISCPSVGRWRFTMKIIRQVKEIAPRTSVVLGGLFPTYKWQHCMDSSDLIDIIMLGEAELGFAEIVNNISKGYTVGGSCKNIDGVVYRDADKIYCNPKLEYNNHLDDLAFPAWHLFDLNKYFLLQRNIFELSTPCLPILSSRSCPNRCRFCNMYITHGSRWRSRSAKNVLDEIEYLIKKFAVHNFYFVDDNFSLDLERAKSICRGIIERRLRIKYNFHNGLSIKTIDEELVRLMKESGCTSVCLAIESGSERIRNEVYGKNLATEKIINVFDLFHKARIPSIAYFILGAPTETRLDFEKTKKLLARLPMSLMTVNIFTPYPGTELYDECRKNGWLLESLLNNENMSELSTPMLKTADFGPKDIIGWRRELYLSFINYHWPALIWEVLRPGGLINFDMVGKFIGILKFSHSSTNKNIELNLNE